ncbi:hypothetical protein DFH08DRAFT_821888 [Mycena albidolilacea]|uniref:Uncharacterized protein n=1 Tax=Mycena albidolilacea TaxID=1033008 RepID=A0AAD7ED36_9AGAR|nr:hypothetical protein DFH08DRAFT_821888 [Mycena albidolilacea]
MYFFWQPVALAAAPSAARAPVAIKMPIAGGENGYDDSDESIDPALRAVKALDNLSDTTTETATGSEFSDDVDDHAADDDGPLVIDEGMLMKAERKATRQPISCRDRNGTRHLAGIGMYGNSYLAVIPCFKGA